VADVVGSHPSIAESNVYGVLVPHSDGRAGCAAVVLTPETTIGKMDWRGLAEFCLQRMPRYAVPIWIRVTAGLEYTGTMKLQKGRLRGEGVDPEVIKKAARERGEEADRLFWLRPGEREYTPFGEKEWLEVKAGKVRL
jgi:acyl-CoA synthetase (AMP-forming)/AMP-acid ligase II